MKYTQPELIVSGIATAAIKGEPVGSKIGTTEDSQSTPHNEKRLTATAYEADE
jgi:hypothetical protein